MTRPAVLSLLTSILLLWLTLPVGGADKTKDEETIRNAATVLEAMVGSKDIPSGVLAKADCVIVLPSVKKLAVGIGGSGARGPMSCRLGNNFSGKWSQPAMYTFGGGLQLGVTSTDYVFLVMSPTAVDKVLNGKVKVGSDVSAAAGPGASAGNAVGVADILTYSRSSGLFAGVSLSGASLSPDSDANQRLYGKAVDVSNIVRGSGFAAAPAASSFVSLLNSKIPKHSDSGNYPRPSRPVEPPAFPWPPPIPSARLVIARETFAQDATFGQFSIHLESALNATGYAEMSYYGVPHGIAVVTRLEHIHPDGHPFDGPERWLVDDKYLRHFSLIDYVERLFAVDEGYYRIVVFIVTDQPFTSTNRSITSTEAGLWLADGLNTLPASLGEQPLSSVDRCTALIYEFEKSHGESAHLLIPSPMEARQHLLASGLLRELSISGVGHER